MIGETSAKAVRPPPLITKNAPSKTTAAATVIIALLSLALMCRLVLEVAEKNFVIINNEYLHLIKIVLCPIFFVTL